VTAAALAAAGDRPANPAAGWAARLEPRYRRADGRTVAHDRHESPLRVPQPLYPEGPAVCHHVLVHPPGGLVGGDRRDIDIALGEGVHALLTTPGATRFCRSDGRIAGQHARLALAAGARLESLPLESIAHPGCDAVNEVSFELAAGAEMIGSDVLALRAAGRRRDALPDAARAHLAPVADDPPVVGGATAPAPGLVVLRLPGHGVEPVMALLQAGRADWRRLTWGLAAHPPRIWRT
jgi:urease accessory protein